MKKSPVHPNKKERDKQVKYMNGQLVDGGRLHKSYSVVAVQCWVVIKTTMQDLTHAAIWLLMPRERDKAAFWAIKISNGLQIQ